MLSVLFFSASRMKKSKRLNEGTALAIHIVIWLSIFYDIPFIIVKLVQAKIPFWLYLGLGVTYVLFAIVWRVGLSMVISDKTK